jgi:hypothetical protein
MMYLRISTDLVHMTLLLLWVRSQYCEVLFLGILQLMTQQQFLVQQMIHRAFLSLPGQPLKHVLCRKYKTMLSLQGTR